MPTQTFSYVKKDGSMGNVNADTPEQAIATAPDRNPQSGVMLSKPTTPPPTGSMTGTTTQQKETTPEAPKFSRLPKTKTTVKTPSEDDVYSTYKEKLLSEASGRVANIDTFYDNQVKIATEAGKTNLARTRSVAALSGLAGAPDANSAMAKTEKRTQQDIEYINSQRATAIDRILAGVEDNARKLTEARLKTNQADAKAEIDKIAENATGYLKGLASQGIEWEDFAKEDPDSLKNLIEQTGKTEQELRGIYNASLPKPVDYKDGAVSKGANGNATIFQYGVNSKGEAVNRKIDTGIPYDTYFADENKIVESKDGYFYLENPKTGEVRKIGGSGKTEKATEGEIKNEEYQKAQQFMIDNPDMKPAEAERYIRANTSLSDGDIESLLSGKTNLNRDYFSTNMTEDQLAAGAKEQGLFVEGSGWLGIGKKPDTEAYLNYLEKVVQQYRDAGYSDKEIYKMMQPEE